MRSCTSRLAFIRESERRLEHDSEGRQVACAVAHRVSTEFELAAILSKDGKFRVTNNAGHARLSGKTGSRSDSLGEEERGGETSDRDGRKLINSSWVMSSAHYPLLRAQES